MLLSTYNILVMIKPLTFNNKKIACVVDYKDLSILLLRHVYNLREFIFFAYYSYNIIIIK